MRQTRVYARLQMWVCARIYGAVDAALRFSDDADLFN